MQPRKAQNFDFFFAKNEISSLKKGTLALDANFPIVSWLTHVKMASAS